eukprot:2004957-Ditylum_brightwellii.AAC.1
MTNSQPDPLPLYCPQNKTSEKSRDVPSIDWPDIPQLWNDAIETVLAISVITFQSATIIASKNELLLAVDLSTPVDEVLEVDVPHNSRSVNLTRLNKDLGSWADIGFDQLCLYLTSMTEDSVKRSGLDLK